MLFVAVAVIVGAGLIITFGWELFLDFILFVELQIDLIPNFLL